MSAPQPDIVAVTDIDKNLCGAMVYWTLRGSTDAAQLETAWEHYGLDTNLLPDTPSIEAALHRAVKDQVSKHRLMRKLDGGGWALVDEIAQGDELDYNVVVRIKADKVGRLSFDEGPAWRGEDHIKREVREDYDKHLDTLSPQDVSKWLVKLIDGCNSVRLRETGGFYFVPRDSLQRWRDMVEAITARASHAMFEIPALTSAEAVNAICDAITTEAEKVADAMDMHLQDEALGHVALRRRSEECQQMAAKVESYESLLGITQDALKKRLDELKVGLATAALMAEGDDD